MVRFKILTSFYLLHITVCSLKGYPGGRTEKAARGRGVEAALLGKNHEAFRERNLTAVPRGSSVPFTHDTMLCIFGTRRLARCRRGAQGAEVFLSKKHVAPALVEKTISFVIREQM